MQTDSTAIQTEKYSVPFVERTGMRPLEKRTGYVNMLMPLAGNENHVGVMYMGAFTVLAEATAATPAIDFLDKKRFFPIIKDLFVDFQRPAGSDVTAEYSLSDADIAALEADLERKGSAGYLAEIAIKDTDCVTVAAAKVTVKLLSHGFKK
ncbi:MAG: DUF4442 domain-containing protein [Parasphingorhabdus sp.]|uniref:PaaI family thioesterase n=1 Tax=Parasphingorhabdus sp. TaxID=2709688 RepID=UPI0032985E07